jgi:NAD(P)-dependent dehydrogenase (short-subunit alcohol dehydrogenase family)
MVSKFAVPFLEKSANAHILALSPPLDLKEKWFAGSTAYSMAKYGMSLVVLGLAGELRSKGIAALWPRTTIATAAIKNLLGGDALMRASRTPDILAACATSTGIASTPASISRRISSSRRIRNRRSASRGLRRVLPSLDCGTKRSAFKRPVTSGGRNVYAICVGLRLTRLSNFLRLVDKGG